VTTLEIVIRKLDKVETTDFSSGNGGA